MFLVKRYARSWVSRNNDGLMLVEGMLVRNNWKGIG